MDHRRRLVRLRDLGGRRHRRGRCARQPGRPVRRLLHAGSRDDRRLHRRSPGAHQPLRQESLPGERRGAGSCRNFSEFPRSGRHLRRTSSKWRTDRPAVQPGQRCRRIDCSRAGQRPCSVSRHRPGAIARATHRRDARGVGADGARRRHELLGRHVRSGLRRHLSRTPQPRPDDSARSIPPAARSVGSAADAGYARWLR